MENKPLTIMCIITGSGRAGSDQLAFNIAKGLKGIGHRVIWGCPSDCYLIGDARKYGLEIFNIFPSGSKDMTVVSALVRFCNDEKIDIVNAHHSYARHMVLSARFRGLKAKIVFTRHCILRTVPYFGKFFHNFLVDMNICVSNAVRKSLVHSGIWPSNAVTVYGAVDVKTFENVSAEKIERARKKYADKRAFNIGIVGRFPSDENFDPKNPTIKGHEVLFKALAEFREEFNLLVVGPWKERDIKCVKLLANYTRLSMDRITFCGYQEDITPFYKIMDLNVLPSPDEGLGLSLIEGMAAGAPGIGTNPGGIKEIIKDGVDGFLFGPKDSSDLAAKIRHIIERKELRTSFVERGREKVRKSFTIERNVLKTQEIFYSLLKQESGSPLKTISEEC